MPASPLATPILLQQAPLPQLPSTQYVMLQPAPTFVPTLPLVNSTFVYPSYGFLTKTEQKTDNDTSLKQQQVITQHIVHHCTCSGRSCPGYCDLCCPWVNETSQRKTPSPPPTYRQQQQQQRHSRRDEYELSIYDSKQETIDEKIERIRRELSSGSFNKQDKSTETIDYYRPPRPTTPPVQQRVPYKQHYDAPKPRSLSRPRSASSHR